MGHLLHKSGHCDSDMHTTVILKCASLDLIFKFKDNLYNFLWFQFFFPFRSFSRITKSHEKTLLFTILRLKRPHWNRRWRRGHYGSWHNFLLSEHFSSEVVILICIILHFSWKSCLEETNIWYFIQLFLLYS